MACSAIAMDKYGDILPLLFYPLHCDFMLFVAVFCAHESCFHFVCCRHFFCRVFALVFGVVLCGAAWVGHCEGLPEAINEQRIPKKARAKLWRSHSTVALWRLRFLILHCSLILTSQPQRTRLCSRFNIDEALWSMT